MTEMSDVAPNITVFADAIKVKVKKEASDKIELPMMLEKLNIVATKKSKKKTKSRFDVAPISRRILLAMAEMSDVAPNIAVFADAIKVEVKKEASDKIELTMMLEKLNTEETK